MKLTKYKEFYEIPEEIMTKAWKIKTDAFNFDMFLLLYIQYLQIKKQKGGEDSGKQNNRKKDGGSKI